VSQKTPITLKAEIAASLTSSNVGSHALILDDKDVIHLLRAAVEREGGQSPFARRHRIDRVTLNRILKGKRPLYGPLVKILGLRKVYVVE
jgi:predicted RNase H-like nuclease (RuvC/YqgF family)